MRRHNGENRCSHANMLVTRGPAHLATFFCVCAWPQYDAQPAIAGARAAAGARIRVHDEGSRAAEAGRAIGRAAISAYNGGQAYQVRACTRAVHLSAAAAAPAALAQLPLVCARVAAPRGRCRPIVHGMEVSPSCGPLPQLQHPSQPSRCRARAERRRRRKALGTRCR